MKFYPYLYTGSSIKKVNMAKWKLRTGAGQFHVYVISLSPGSDQLDIFHCSMLRQRYFDRENLYVVGIAGNEGEAYQLVGKMLADSLAAGMEGDIKGYLTQRIREGGGG